MSQAGADLDQPFDAIVIGTGFGGAVTAARLVEAGLRVCVLERGRKYEGNDFPSFPDAEMLLDIDGGSKPKGAAPDLTRWLWSVDQGIYDVRDLDDVVSVQAAGYGGGSLIYANVHLRAPNEVFDQGWPAVYRRETLDPYYDRVAYMLDVRPMPKGEALGLSDGRSLRKSDQMKRLGGSDGPPGLVHAIDPPLAVTFDVEGQRNAKDERFWTDGERPQKPCDMRGQCWLGCRQGAKNSLDFNYLRLVEMAEKFGGSADIRLGAEVTKIERIEADDGKVSYAVHYRDHLTPSKEGRPGVSAACKTFKADYVFLAAGAVNTTELLMRSKDKLRPGGGKGRDAELSPALGSRYFPNADSLAAVFDCDQPQHADHGPTITSALLYQKPRTVEGAANGEVRNNEVADDDAANNGVNNGEKFLWAIDFRPTSLVADAAIKALQPGAAVHLGRIENRQPQRDSEFARLVDPPIFDVGSFAERRGVAMLVVEAAPKADHDDCRTLSVQTKEQGWLRFGVILGKARKFEDWFLVEDGGYPTDIEPLLGIFRSPLWLRRNRFIEPFKTRSQIATDHDRDRWRHIEEQGPLHFPLATAMEALLGTPRRTTAMSMKGGEASKIHAGGFPASPLDIPPDKMLPEWFRDALASDRTELAKAAAPIVGRMLEDVLDDVAERLVDRFEDMNLAANFTDDVADAIGTVPRPRQADLIRGMLRQTIQLLWGSEVALAERVNQLLIDKIPKDAYSLANALSPFVGWLLNYREGNGKTALLLAMGRDQYRGRLAIDPERDRLTATLPRPSAPGARAAQERVLRDIARTWKGELRTNPAWTGLNRRVTVHSQGGCPMCVCKSGENADHNTLDADACVCMGVTRPNGEVIGSPGLYVMDAAAFPTAVGVNPSATIAAVAEYKVEQFIKNELCDERHMTWTAKTSPKLEALDRWLGALELEHGDEHVLDPLARIGGEESASPRSASIGLSFEETMSGLVEDLHIDRSGRLDGKPSCLIDWEGLADLENQTVSFERSEEKGLDQNNLLTLKLKASIDDLDRFFRSQRQGLAMRIGLSGDVHLKDEGAYHVDPSKSYLQIFAKPPSDGAFGDQRRRFFRYRIVASPICPCWGLESEIWIEGVKLLSNDPRFDVWQDLSTLYIDVFDQEPKADEPLEPRIRGILRLAPLDFFEKQLQSISITPKDSDPARKSWAYGGFIRYFTDELASIYVERRGLIKAMVTNLLNPSRGG